MADFIKSHRIRDRKFRPNLSIAEVKGGVPRVQEHIVLDGLHPPSDLASLIFALLIDKLGLSLMELLYLLEQVGHYSTIV